MKKILKCDGSIVRKAAAYVGIVALFIVLSYAFVPEVLSGKIVNQGDISSWRGMSNEAVTYNAQHPEDKTRWTNSMFGGMPTTATIDDFDGDWTKALYRLLLTGRRPATYFFIALLGGFLLMLSFGCGLIPAIGGAIAIAFCSYNMQIVQVGHNTKMQAIAFFPWVLAGVVYTYRCAMRGLKGGYGLYASDGVDGAAACLKGNVGGKGDGNVGGKNVCWRSWLPWTVLSSVLFALALSMQIKANHPQITYYLAIVILVYALTLFVWACIGKEERKQRLQRFFAASALLLAVGCVGIATNANKLIPTYEYAKYTMRGGSELAADKAEHAGDAKAVKEARAAAKGLDLEYATAWSYGINEMPNLLIPNFNGGASACDPHLKHGATEELLRKAGQPNVKQMVKQLPMYWGPQPFTAGPMYLGAVTIFLFVLGLFLFRGKDKWWILIATLIAVFLAWGSHFMWFTRLWFNYAPMYSKFRTVSMALTVLQVTVPLLGFLTLDKILKAEYDGRRVIRSVAWAAGITGGFCLLMALFPGLAGDFSSASDAGMQDILVGALKQDRMAMLRRDARSSFILIVLASAVILMIYGKKPVARLGRASLAGCLVALLVLCDLFSIGKRYLNSDHFISPKNWEAQFRERQVDREILADKDLSYRVLDISVNTFNDAHQSYRHKCIGGYSPVKLQRYQDLIERYITPEIRSIYKAAGECATVGNLEDNLPFLKVTSMLNGKYIVLGEDYSPIVNRRAFGNCWFVDNAVTAATVNEEIDLIADTDLENTVILGPDFKDMARSRAFSGRADGGLSCNAAGDVTDALDGDVTGCACGKVTGCACGNAACRADGDEIRLTSYEPNELHYLCRCSSERAAVFSEIFYPKGWKAWIGPAGKVGDTVGNRFKAAPDAVEAELFRGDWMLRGLIVPEGEHEIVMRFEPESYAVGARISTASSALLILLVLLSAAGAVAFGKNTDKT